jgi:hypothetical protein
MFGVWDRPFKGYWGGPEATETMVKVA